MDSQSPSLVPWLTPEIPEPTAALSCLSPKALLPTSPQPPHTVWVVSGFTPSERGQGASVWAPRADAGRHEAASPGICLSGPSFCAAYVIESRRSLGWCQVLADSKSFREISGSEVVIFPVTFLVQGSSPASPPLHCERAGAVCFCSLCHLWSLKGSKGLKGGQGGAERRAGDPLWSLGSWGQVVPSSKWGFWRRVLPSLGR